MSVGTRSTTFKWNDNISKKMKERWKKKKEAGETWEQTKE